MRPYRQWLHRQGVLGSALLAWLALSAAPATTSPEASGLDLGERAATRPAEPFGQTVNCDADCLSQLRERLLELHRQRAPVWLL